MAQPEKTQVADPLRRALRAQGWHVAKTHGNLYQSGWPDLYCYHREYGTRWVEVKTKRGRLTPAQFERFTEWTNAGVPIWVLTEPRPDLLFEPPNVSFWLQRYRPNARKKVERYFR